MIQGVDLLDWFNLASLVVFVVCTLLAAGKIFWRLGAFLFTFTPVPILLKRDLYLISAFVLLFGSALVVRLFGIDLSEEPLWVVPRNVLVLSAMVYWVWVEYHLDDPRDVQKKRQAWLFPKLRSRGKEPEEGDQ